MTRHMPTTRRSRVRLALEVGCFRDETSRSRHEWTCTLTFGLLTARGVNQREAADSLAAQILALASSPAAMAGLAVEAQAEHAVYLADQAAHGTEEALRRVRLRAAGIDPSEKDPEP